MVAFERIMAAAAGRSRWWSGGATAKEVVARALLLDGRWWLIGCLVFSEERHRRGLGESADV